MHHNVKLILIFFIYSVYGKGGKKFAPLVVTAIITAVGRAELGWDPGNDDKPTDGGWMGGRVRVTSPPCLGCRV